MTILVELFFSLFRIFLTQQKKNLEPQQLGISPSEFGLQSPTNNWAQFKDQIFPPHVEQRISDWSHQKLNETITAQKPVTPLKICRSLIDYVKQLTEPTRIFYNTNPGKKTPPNHQNYPGKLDHSTCLCGKIGPSNLSVEDLCKDIFGNEVKKSKKKLFPMLLILFSEGIDVLEFFY